MGTQKAISVLIIDDDELDRMSIKRALNAAESLKFGYSEAATREESISLLEKGNFDVVLVDYRLTDSNGLDLIRYMNQQVLDQQYAIIMLSHQKDESLAEQALDVGAHDFLLKDDVDTRRIVRTIRQAMYRNKLENRVNQQTNELRQLAENDALTGLSNRYTFEQILKNAFSRITRISGTLGVLFLDLDEFKYVNDLLGHNTGDELLKEIAFRLRNVIRGNDFLARLGGDEFVVLAQDIDEEKQISNLASRIIASLKQPFKIQNNDITISVSVGIAAYGPSASTPAEIMKCADIAMYQAKMNGRNQFCFYTHDLHHQISKRACLEADLRKAIQERQFELYYQPQISCKTGMITGMEALIRWNHPTRGFLSPVEFISLAEQIGLMPQIGSWVLHHACCQFREWQLKFGLNDLDLTMSVNVSAKQLLRSDFVDSVKVALHDSGLNPFSLKLELTENALIHNPESVACKLQMVKEMGVHIALDDFGTGYSSLQHIRMFPIHTLKIDKSFLDTAGDGSTLERLLIAVVQFGKTLGLYVIAEGVEESFQLEFCKRNNVDSVQGYYFAKPLSCKDFEAYFYGAKNLLPKK
ncbi:putative bifunctional diguanylate cyclase/phosphodiesterase [Aliiglaciecola lipolytica]|uniref:Cyclic di-GMP phosphodiesterase Gmr n=1 Tax=Aliiglaciecola lipolytica E3 TaxID=1127673 RepID=K6X7U0_9ALTE|nr:EAL domain-containing protein [Aliiglaciecola lipolytica]GAC16689.1 cyclic di-GMP phosphodiesterase Gmr [Aliiglaciecola lipolytica E3]